METILRAKYWAFSGGTKRFALCVTLIREAEFSISRLYELSLANNFSICSEIKVDKLNETLCRDQGGEFWIEYKRAGQEGFTFNFFPDQSIQRQFLTKIPRLIESDVETAVVNLGGNRIPESEIQTPDFEISGVPIELKDLQIESLLNQDRQKSIAKLFANLNAYAINLDPSISYGEISHQYFRLMRNTIKNHFKKASKQIKSFCKGIHSPTGGIIITNTGMISLPHKIFVGMVEEILTRETKTIKYALVISQKTQTNGWKSDTLYYSEWLGKPPTNISRIREELMRIIDSKMTEFAIGIYKGPTIPLVEPISFEIQSRFHFLSPTKISIKSFLNSI